MTFSLRARSLLVLLGLAPALALADDVSLRLKTDLLQTSTLGQAAPTSTLVILVADTSGNGFASLTGSSLGSGTGNVFSSGFTLNGASDDLVLWRGDLSAFGTPGVLNESLFTLTLGTYGGRTWNAGDGLALLWFPSLDLSSTTASVGTSYGFVTGGTTAWTTPAGGSSAEDLFIFTSNSAVNGVGSSSPSLLVASQTVSAIPEPATNAALAAFAALGVAWYRRRTLRA